MLQNPTFKAFLRFPYFLEGPDTELEPNAPPYLKLGRITAAAIPHGSKRRKLKLEARSRGEKYQDPEQTPPETLVACDFDPSPSPEKLQDALRQTAQVLTVAFKDQPRVSEKWSASHLILQFKRGTFHLERNGGSIDIHDPEGQQLLHITPALLAADPKPLLLNLLETIGIRNYSDPSLWEGVDMARARTILHHGTSRQLHDILDAHRLFYNGLVTYVNETYPVPVDNPVLTQQEQDTLASKIDTDPFLAPDQSKALSRSSQQALCNLFKQRAILRIFAKKGYPRLDPIYSATELPCLFPHTNLEPIPDKPDQFKADLGRFGKLTLQAHRDDQDEHGAFIGPDRVDLLTLTRDAGGYWHAQLEWHVIRVQSKDDTITKLEADLASAEQNRFQPNLRDRYYALGKLPELINRYHDFIRGREHSARP